MGFDEAAFTESEEEMIAGALDNPTNPYLNGVTLEALKKSPFVKLDMTPKYHLFGSFNHAFRQD